MSEMQKSVGTGIVPGGVEAGIDALLLKRGLATEEEIERARSAQAETGQRLGEILVRQGIVAEDDLLSVLSDALGLNVAGEADLPSPPDVVDCALEFGVPLEWLVDRSAVIWRGRSGELTYAARDPLNPLLLETLDRISNGAPVFATLARVRLIDGLVEALRQSLNQDRSGGDALRDLAEDAPTVTFVDGIIAEAAGEGASDVHIEPDERQLTVRFRVDGILKVRSVEARSRFDAISSRIKLLAGLDIAERRLPQDGRMSRRIGGEKIDFRVSTLPGAHGESIVLRLLRSQKQVLRLDELGMEADHSSTLRQLISAPHGMILVTGPTGSGKTTTLYAALAEIKDGKRKLVTVEDPIEYMMEGVTQVQVRADIGYDFARALRSILRQDPDVIMVGEIRDAETARIAIQAALTGHLVFSTVHTNDAVGAVSRIIDMGVEPFLLAAAVRGVIAQRLVRRVRTDRVEPAEADPAYVDRLPPLTPRRFVKPKAEFSEAAYSGRLAVYEMIAVDSALERATSRAAPADELRKIARAGGARSLFDDAMLKAARGITTVSEALRVAAEDVK